MSGSSAKTSTTSSQSTSVRNLNLQDTGGITVADTKGPTSLVYQNISTDGGALKTASDIAGGAFRLGGQAIDANTDISHAALDLGGQALSTGQQLANAGLDNAAAAYQSGLTFGTNALDLVHSLTDEFASQNSNLVNNALAGYQSIAAQNSASSSTQIQKIAIYAIGAAVLLVVLPKVFK